jgi:Tol biopolymer transport system component
VTRESPGVAFPTWSPDGRRLAATHTAGQDSALLLFSLEKPGEIERKILSPQKSNQFAPFSFSRDGRWLAGSSFAYAPEQQVLLYSLSDGALRFLAAGRTPLFLSDSRRLLFQTVGGGLALIDMQDGRIRPVLPDGVFRTRSGGLEVSLSSDDRKIAYVDTHREGDVWLMHLGGAAPAGTPAPPP